MFTEQTFLTLKPMPCPLSLKACKQRSLGTQQGMCVCCWPQKQVAGPSSGEDVKKKKLSGSRVLFKGRDFQPLCLSAAFMIHRKLTSTSSC